MHLPCNSLSGYGFDDGRRYLTVWVLAYDARASRVYLTMHAFLADIRSLRSSLK